jgi:hypothetical protein
VTPAGLNYAALVFFYSQKLARLMRKGRVIQFGVFGAQQVLRKTFLAQRKEMISETRFDAVLM